MILPTSCTHTWLCGHNKFHQKHNILTVIQNWLLFFCWNIVRNTPYKDNLLPSREPTVCPRESVGTALSLRCLQHLYPAALLRTLDPIAEVTAPETSPDVATKTSNCPAMRHNLPLRVPLSDSPLPLSLPSLEPLHIFFNILFLLEVGERESRLRTLPVGGGASSGRAGNRRTNGGGARGYIDFPTTAILPNLWCRFTLLPEQQISEVSEMGESGLRSHEATNG